MDLLTGYGSGDSDSEQDEVPRPASASEKASAEREAASKAMPAPALPASKVTSQPKPANQEAAGSLESNLWSRMPQPSTQTTSTSGLSALPPPSAGTRGGRKLVSMQLPFHKQLLEAALDSDDEDEPAAKRVRTTGAKSCLMDFLPPPKHDITASAALGAGPSTSAKAGAAAGRGAARGSGTAATPPPPASGSDAALPPDFFSAGSLSAEAYRVQDDDDGGGSTAEPYAAAAHYPNHYPAGPVDGSGAQYYDSSTYGHAGPYATQYGPGPGAGPPHAAYPRAGGAIPAAAATAPRAQGRAGAVGGSPEPEDLIAEALRAEQQRASKRGGGAGAQAGVKLVEINARDLTHMDPAAREAAASARDALGADYALSLRRSAAPFEGSKMARRKHQIGTLLFNARMQELDHMEKRTQGQKSKAETAAKYGW